MDVGVAKLVLVMEFDTVRCVTTHHFRGVGGPQDLDALISRWALYCESSWLAIHPPEYVLAELSAIEQPGPGDAAASSVAYFPGTPGTREHVSEVAPPMLVLWSTTRTRKIGKRYRGRYAISGAVENDFTGRDLAAGPAFWQAKIAAYNANLLGYFREDTTTTGNVWDLVVYSRKRDSLGGLLDVGGVSTRDACEPVTDIAVRPQLRSLRSRET